MCDREAARNRIIYKQLCFACYSCHSPIASVCESSTGQIPVADVQRAVTPLVAFIAHVHDTSLFSGLASSHSSLHQCESSVAHYSDVPTALCNSVSGDH